MIYLWSASNAELTPWSYREVGLRAGKMTGYPEAVSPARRITSERMTRDRPLVRTIPREMVAG
jgi:hypothetical protein